MLGWGSSQQKQQVSNMDWFQEKTPEDYRLEERARKDHWSLNLLINPSTSELGKLCRKAGSEGLRGLVVGDDLYWWNAWYGTHNDAIKWMGRSDLNRSHGVEAHLYEDGFVGLTATTNDLVNELMEHPRLRGKFMADGSLIEN
jgi:hypothetical protein